MGDPYQDMMGGSLPPPAAGGNEATFAPYAPPGQEIPVPQPSSATIFGGGPNSSYAPTPSPTPTATPYPVSLFDSSGLNKISANDLVNPPANPDFSTTGAPWTEPGNQPQVVNYYPNGQGGFWGYDANWNFVGEFPGSTNAANIPGITFQTPGGPSDLPNRGPLYAPEGAGKPPGFFSDLGADIRDIGRFPGTVADFMGRAGNTLGKFFGDLGTSTPFNDPSAFGMAPSDPFGQRNPFVGGAFATNPGNINLVGLGQGSAGNVNFGNYDYWGQMGLKNLMQGTDPSLGMPGQGNFGQSNFQGRPLADVLPTSQWGGTGFAGDSGTPYGTGAVNPDFPARSAK